jgi:hypothetical protein
MGTLDEAFEHVRHFKGTSLRERIRTLESQLRGAQQVAVQRLVKSESIELALFRSALLLKRSTGQINEVVHSVGILMSLPRILDSSEGIEYLSLAAGNTGRPFDLETDRRIAEFKFIDWKGGSESIRQNSLFKDFFQLVEYPTDKDKYLYVLGLDHPMHFFNGGRACHSVMSKESKVWRKFSEKYGSTCGTVREFYELKKSCVRMLDLTAVVPELTGIADLMHS